jgi:ppGpp synthetase/RelA/SpoT-type nucleotidyltranferase
MPEAPRLSRTEERRINEAVDHFRRNRDKFERLGKNLHSLLVEHPLLQPYVHSVKYRVKDPDHLRDKLVRKTAIRLATGRGPVIDSTNLFDRIEDLAGVRLLHLHTSQMSQIGAALSRVFAEEHYRVVGGPVANTWDDEYREYFRSIGINTTPRASMYTSVHYILQPATRLKCELQVRTLVEEVWGEVSHKINYPHETRSIACQEQIKVLARVSSSCTRLVDSIFASQVEHSQRANSTGRQGRGGAR